MFANIDSDTDFLCVVQSIIDIGANAVCTIFVDIRFSRDGSVFHIADFNGRNNVVAAITVIAQDIKCKQKWCYGIDPAGYEMDAVVIYSNVCMDAVWIGVVLDSV